MRERESGCVCDRESVYARERKRDSVRERERERESGDLAGRGVRAGRADEVGIRERERESVCVRV